MAAIPKNPNLEGLVDLACRSGVDVRPTLLRVLTDLYVQKPRHTAEEEAQYVELAQRLIEAVDGPTRATVAARLAAYPGAPPAVFNRLAALMGSLPVPATAREPEPAPAQSPDSDLIDLFFNADRDERRLILINLDATAPTGRPVLPAALETCRRLEAAALSRNSGEFARILASTLIVAPALAARVVQDVAGEPLLVAAKALGMQSAMLQRILLFINPAIGQSVAQVYELANLYDEISPHAAERMIDIWRGAERKKRPVHQPIYHDDDRKTARSAATPSRYASARRSESLSTRYKSSGR